MPTTLHWFRRDLRLRDNTALLAACRDADAVACAYIIDPRWFGHPDHMSPYQTAFLLESLRDLQSALAARNIPLVIRSSPDLVAALLALAKEARADTLTYNKDYEPAQVAQDERLQSAAQEIGLAVRPHKDAALFEEEELLTTTGSVYSVFTPYKNAWLKKLLADPPSVGGLPRKPPRTLRVPSEKIPPSPAVTLNPAPGEPAAHQQLTRFITTHLANYAQNRNIPALPGTSRLSAHLSAGTLSPRQILAALQGVSEFRTQNSPFLSQLIWRDFYKTILYHYPHTTHRPFNHRYAALAWQNNPAHFAAWKSARTGIPIIDAAITQLTTAGFMHNRLRMITAMFLTKNLDTHWTLGETFFKQNLVDYDQANNVGGWQWSASTGTDAAPYFRIMNPTLQSQRFDSDGAFIRQYLPALQHVPQRYIHTPWQMPKAVQRESKCLIGQDYPAPIIDLARSKAAAIAKFKAR